MAPHCEELLFAGEETTVAATGSTAEAGPWQAHPSEALMSWEGGESS